MKKSILAMTLLSFSVAFSGISRANGQTQNNRNYLQAFNLATDAAYYCYKYGINSECNRLNQIENILINWCSQNDEDACITLDYVEENVAIQRFPTR